MPTHTETPIEYQQRKEREKRLKELAVQFPNQAGAVVVQGGKPRFPSVQVMRPAPGAPLTMPNGMPTPKSANPRAAGHEGQTNNPTMPTEEQASLGEFNTQPSAASFYNLNPTKE